MERYFSFPYISVFQYVYLPHFWMILLLINLLHQFRKVLSETSTPYLYFITLPGEKLRKYFPRSYTPMQIETTIFKLLDAWQRKRQREQSR